MSSLKLIFLLCIFSLPLLAENFVLKSCMKPFRAISDYWREGERQRDVMIAEEQITLLEKKHKQLVRENSMRLLENPYLEIIRAENANRNNARLQFGADAMERAREIATKLQSGEWNRESLTDRQQLLMKHEETRLSINQERLRVDEALVRFQKALFEQEWKLNEAKRKLQELKAKRK